MGTAWGSESPESSYPQILTLSVTVLGGAVFGKSYLEESLPWENKEVTLYKTRKGLAPDINLLVP